MGSIDFDSVYSWESVEDFDKHVEKPIRMADEGKKYILAYNKCISILGVDLTMGQVLKLQQKMFAFCFNTVVNQKVCM